MEVIFDTHMLKPVLSPTMKTALSVLGLIGRSLVEANKCMKERVATETGQPPTLDDVMKQSGLTVDDMDAGCGTCWRAEGALLSVCWCRMGG